MTWEVMACAPHRARMRPMTAARTASSTAAHAAHPGARDPFGHHLRHWRQHRRLSQLDLAQDAEISTRHLSYVETGRAAPSREMVLRLADRLQVPLRERNTLLVAAGFAPMYRQRSLDDPEMALARQAVQRVLQGHEPYPALAVDRHWNLLAHNALVPLLMAGCAPELLAPPLNVLRLSLHPQGLAARIANLRQWRDHLLERLQQQTAATGDAELQALHDELAAYACPPPSPTAPGAGAELASVVVPFQLRTEAGLLSFISTTTLFGTPMDVTLQELAVESFFPADAATAQALQALMATTRHTD